MEIREPKLGVAVGRKGCGKTYTTTKMIKQYVLGNPAKGIPARRALILDVNDEFEEFKALKQSDIIRFSMHPKIEARRIRPFHDNGIKMTLREIQELLFKILNDYRGGLLLIEDINRYISDYLPNDLVGAICTNRHQDLDIILHFQSICAKIKFNVDLLICLFGNSKKNMFTTSYFVLSCYGISNWRNWFSRFSFGIAIAGKWRKNSSYL
jgi:hypothetical protein